MLFLANVVQIDTCVCSGNFFTFKNNLVKFISGSYGTVVVRLKIWRRKLIEIANEYMEI